MDALSLLVACGSLAVATFTLLKAREDRQDLETDQADLNAHLFEVETLARNLQDLDTITKTQLDIDHQRLTKLEENEKRFAISRGKRGAGKAAKTNGNSQQPALTLDSYFGEEPPLREKASAEEGEES